MSRPLHAALREGAVDWLLLLDSGRATAEDRARFERWVNERDEHAQAWADVHGLMAQPLAALQATPGAVQAARATLMQPSRIHRRRLLQLAALAPVGMLAGWAVNRQTPLATLTADVRTHTAERQRVVLDDGSVLVLNARSAADIRYDNHQRAVWLRRGELYAESRPDARPFVVHTDAGSVVAGTARLAVRRTPQTDLVHALASELQIRPAQGHPLTLTAPAWASFDRAHARLGTGPSDASWQHGVLKVQDDSLSEVVERLRAYQAGVIRITPAAGELRVFGIFPLDDPARALQALGDTLPIHVRRYGPWLTTIDVA